MNNKFNIFICFSLIFCQAAAAKPLSGELVDLHKSHWAFTAASKIIDKYNLIQGFPDHTFRGDKGVSRYEFSAIILNLIKHLEEDRKLSLKSSEAIAPEYKDKSFTDIPKNNWAQAAITELKDNYNLIVSPPYEKTFGGNKNINRFELAFVLDKLVSLVTKQDLMEKNPYEAETKMQDARLTKITPESWAAPGIKNLNNFKIMVGNGSKDFRGHDEVTRYQLATALVKALEYFEKN